MTIYNSTLNDFAITLQSVRKSDVLDTIRSELQENLNDEASDTNTILIIDEFFETFSRKFIAENIKIKNFLQEDDKVRTDRELLFNFLAANAELCQVINEQYHAESLDDVQSSCEGENYTYEKKTKDVTLSGLHQSAIDTAVNKQNAEFFLFGLQVASDNILESNINNKFSMLKDGLIKLVTDNKDIDISGIILLLEDVREEHGESSLRWKNNEGPLYNKLNEIKFKQTQQDTKTVVFSKPLAEKVSGSLNEHRNGLKFKK